jgi:peptide deformylase
MTDFVYDTTKTKTFSITEPKFTPYQLTDKFNQLLKTKLKDFDFSDPQLDPIDIASRLIETANLHKVYGVAANQCGLPHRVFIAGSEEEFVAFFNPEIITESIEEVMMEESDLSNMALLLHIKRPKSISVQFQDFNGEQKVLQFEGLTARIVQQNIDRLNGIDFTEKVSKFVLDRAKKTLDKKIKRFFKIGVRK